MNVDAPPERSVAALGVADARGRPALCIVVEAAWEVVAGACRPAAAPPIELAGIWHGEPGASTPHEPPASPVPKAGTDVVVHGHAVAPAVDIRVGPLRQRMRVCGDRTWVRTWRGVRPSDPQPWERIPLTWERACGGGDGDAVEARNPLGCGFRQPGSRFVEGVALPNLEHPERPLRRWGETPPPVGCAWTLPAFAHRAGREAFDPRGANAAAPELVAAPGLRGDEAVAIDGVLAAGPWSFRLPAPSPPRIQVACRDGDLAPEAMLDTIVLHPGAGTVRMAWRAWTLVPEHGLIDAVVAR